MLKENVKLKVKLIKQPMMIEKPDKYHPGQNTGKRRKPATGLKLHYIPHIWL